MSPDQMVSVLGQMFTALQQSGLVAGDVLHTVQQLRTAIDYANRGYDVSINQQAGVLELVNGKLVSIDRVIDVVARRAGELDLNIEVKTGAVARAIPTLSAAFADGEKNLQFLHDLVAGASGEVRNVWQLMSTSIEQAKPTIEKRLLDWGTFLEEHLRYSKADVERAIESFQFVDAFGNAIEYTWGPAGPIAKKALDAASHSPDFTPAMAELFGPSGKVADAATLAAGGADLTAAEQGLEKKLTDGISGALEKAGDAAQKQTLGQLSASVSSGATALGGALSSVPQLYDSVTKLGEAWNKPLHSTKDYMDLLGAAGATVSQAGQALQAFTGLTQVAAAAQAVFNAVMALNPVVLVVIAVVALIAAIALLIVYWDQVKAALRDNPWLAVAASLLGIIGIIIVIIAYWDEIKLAVLIAANFISIQAQRIGLFFVGLGTLIGQVWDWITATAANVGISILNAFIAAGVAIQNFFIGVINWVLGKYNDLADSALGDLIGLQKADLIPEVDVQTKLIPPKDVPTIDVDAAFKPKAVTGGLEAQIQAQQAVVAAGQKEDADRRAGAATPAGAPAPGAPSAAPALPPVLPAAPGGLPAGAAPGPGGAPQAGGGPADQSVHVEGGITVTINAERLEADSAQLLTDRFIEQIQARLGELRATADFRVGARPQQA